MTSPAAPRAERPRRAFAYGVASHLFITIGDAMSKAVVTVLPVPQFVAVRAAVIVVASLPLAAAAWRRGERVFTTSVPGLHLVRLFFALIAIAAFLTGLKDTPVATAIAIALVSPVIIAVLGIFILGEKVDRSRWRAIGLGLAGCVIILKPTAEGVPLSMLLILAGVLSWCVVQVVLRRMTATESPAAILILFNTGVCIATAAVAWFNWQPMTRDQLAMIIAMGVLQALSQWLSAKSYQWGRAATVAPAFYTSIIWATIIGWVFWNDFPGPNVWLGTAVVIASGMLLLRGFGDGGMKA